MMRSPAKYSLAIAEALLEPDDTALAFPLQQLAELYYLQGKYADAEPLQLRSMHCRDSFP